MQKRIKELAAGKCNGSSSLLHISVEQLEFEVLEGSNYTDKFTMESTDGTIVKGMVYSSNPRLECHNPGFEGEKIIQTFEFHGEGLNEGDSGQGNIHIICNLGEYDIPFFASVVRNYADSSMGKIRTTLQFANLARKSYEEAAKVFGKPEFIHSFKTQEMEEKQIYRMLMRQPCTMAQVEEFLIAVKKKGRIKFQVEEAEREFCGIRENVKQHITLKKEEWGYAAIEMSSDAQWLQPVRNVIISEAFVGSRAMAEYMIVAEKLHQGKNFARITLKTMFQTEQIQICVLQKHMDHGKKEHEIRKKKIEICKAYIDFGLRKIVTGAWAKLTGQKLDELHLMEPDNLWYSLAKSQVFLINRQRQEAEWALNAFPKNQVDKESPLYAYYMYICTLCEPEPSYVNKMAAKVRKIYKSNQNNNLLFWILLFLDEELNYNQSRKLEVIEKQLARGAESPSIYLEAYRIFLKEPYLLAHPGVFERKILGWAAKYHAITKELAEQVCRFASKISSYHLIWYKILCECYAVYEEKEMLQAICSYCIKWNCYGKRFFKWYHMGIEAELHVAGIFESWMLSAEKEQMDKIPKAAVMYFQFHSGLPYRPQAMLYGTVIEHKSSWKNSYLHYKQGMEIFALKQLSLGRMDKYIAPIYQEILTPEMITEELAECLEKVLFVHEATCSNPNAHHFVVRQYPLKNEQVVPIKGGIGYVNIYSDSYQILLEDARGNRFLPEETITVRPLLDSAKFLDASIACAKEKLLFLIKYFDKKKIWQTYKKEDLQYLPILMESDAVSEEYKSELRPQIIAYYYNHSLDALDEFLLSLPFDGMQRQEREEMMELLVGRRHYERIYELLQTYGSDCIPATKLVYVICNRMEEQEQEEQVEPDEFLLALCRQVFFKGKYNERILLYMCHFFHGNMEEMVKLWQAACDFELDTYMLEERCLLQYLYTGDFSVSVEKIFESYGENHGKEDIILAYLTQMSHQYVTRDAVVSSYVFKKILKLLKGKQELNEICRLGFLKWCANGRELSLEEEQWAETILKMYILQGKSFAFYRTLPEKLVRKYLYYDTIFLEYRTIPDARVMVCFLPERNLDYKEYEMKQMYDGIYVREFQIFYGEKIPYYIKEEQNGEWIVTESGQLQNQELCTSAEGSRYDLLNDMMVSWHMKDEVTLLKRLETYERQDKLVKERFHIV